ncbi:MAG: hypothetical protein ACXWMJ_10330 [Syntrophales bacterium]
MEHLPASQELRSLFELCLPAGASAQAGAFSLEHYAMLYALCAMRDSV